MFQNIGTVTAAINAPRGREYSYFDNTTEPAAYYRLKLVDADQKVSYSRIIKIERNKVQNVQVFMQNPVTRMLNVTIDSRINAMGTISVINNLGQVMFRKQLRVIQGQQSFVYPVDGFGKGMYYFVTEIGEMRDTKPFVKR